LEVARLARGRSAPELRASFDGVAEIGALVDAAFAGQVNEEIDTVQQVTGRTFCSDERAALRDTLHRSMSASIAGVALTHPSFVRVACALGRDGAAALGTSAAPRGPPQPARVTFRASIRRRRSDTSSWRDRATRWWDRRPRSARRSTTIRLGLRHALT